MAVNVDGQTDFSVEGLDHAFGAVRGEHAGHVLDGDGVCAELFELLTVLEEAIERVDRRHGVGNRALEVGSAFLDGVRVVDDVADIVQGVEDAEDVNAVLVGCMNEARAHFTGIVLVADEVLTTRKHGKTGVGGLRLNRAEAIPRILIEETQTRIERRTAPCLDGPIPNAIHLGQDREHIPDGHTRSPQALLTIANGGVHDL